MYYFPVFKVSVNEVLGQVVPPGHGCISKSGWKFTDLYQENDILTLPFISSPGCICSLGGCLTGHDFYTADSVLILTLRQDIVPVIRGCKMMSSTLWLYIRVGHIFLAQVLVCHIPYSLYDFRSFRSGFCRTVVIPESCAGFLAAFSYEPLSITLHIHILIQRTFSPPESTFALFNDSSPENNILPKKLLI